MIGMVLDHNPLLRAFLDMHRLSDAKKGRIQHVDDVDNIPWQTRADPPTSYENSLGDALISCFEEGIDDLALLVARLNKLEVYSPDGSPWTEENFKTELERLGG